MKMTPFYDMYGTILGHIDLDMCRRTRTSYIVDNGPDDFRMPVPTDRETISADDSVEIFHLPIYEIKFRNDSRDEEVVVHHLVVEIDDIPAWFWKSKAVVDYKSYSWKPVDA